MRLPSFAPHEWLVVLIFLVTLDFSLMAAHGKEASGFPGMVWTVVYALSLASWVKSDRRKRNVSVPLDHEALVFFAWPVAMPYYLYRTRGGKGLLEGIGFHALYLSPF